MKHNLKVGDNLRFSEYRFDGILSGWIPEFINETCTVNSLSTFH